jgi:hypothetical protein
MEPVAESDSRRAQSMNSLSDLVASNLATSETADSRSLLIFRYFSASDLYLTTAVEDDLKNLIGQVPVSHEIIQN